MCNRERKRVETHRTRSLYDFAQSHPCGKKKLENETPSSSRPNFHGSQIAIRDRASISSGISLARGIYTAMHAPTSFSNYAVRLVTIWSFLFVPRVPPFSPLRYVSDIACAHAARQTPARLRCISVVSARHYVHA